MLLKLVRIIFRSCKCETWRDDALNGGIIGKIKEEGDAVQTAVRFKVLLEEACGLHVNTHRSENDGEVVFVSIVHVLGGSLDQACLTHDLRSNLHCS